MSDEEFSGRKEIFPPSMWLFRSQDPSVDSRPLTAAQASSYGTTADHAEVRIYRDKRSMNFGSARFEKYTFEQKIAQMFEKNRFDSLCTKEYLIVLMYLLNITSLQWRFSVNAVLL